MDCFKLLGCDLENYLNGIEWHPGHSRNYYPFAILFREKIHFLSFLLYMLADFSIAQRPHRQRAAMRAF